MVSQATRICFKDLTMAFQSLNEALVYFFHLVLCLCPICYASKALGVIHFPNEAELFPAAGSLHTLCLQSEISSSRSSHGCLLIILFS